MYKRQQFHNNKELIKDPIKYPIETQIFSSVFTEKLIEEAIKRKCDIIIEGTMRNPDVPLKLSLIHISARTYTRHSNPKSGLGRWTKLLTNSLFICVLTHYLFAVKFVL